MTILVITTGGTIGALAVDDPLHPPQFSTMPPDGTDLVKECLATSFSDVPHCCVSFEPRDSKLIDDDYRQRLAQVMQAAPENKILLTHGTDSLLQSADYFYRLWQKQTEFRSKTLVLTGAMVPLAHGGMSDGFLNLRYALQQLATEKLADGVYVVLCDYVNAEKRQDWEPRLYSYAPGKYHKYYDPDDGSRSRIVIIG